MFGRIISVLAIGVLLASCETANDRRLAAEHDAAHEARQALFDSTIPICRDSADCDAKWEMAQIWVSNNAGQLIKTVTNVLIETEAGPQNDPNMAAQVTKTPIGDGRYQILIALWCRNWLACNGHPLRMGVDFNRTVGGAAENSSPAMAATKPR